MNYQLVLAEDPSEEQGKAVGENVFLQNVPQDCKVYLFYYPGSLVNPELESALRDLGEMSGNNLFVNIGRLDDPEYDKIRNHFGIKPLPVIVITADPTLASPLDTYATGFVRIDSKTLLNSPERTINCVQEVLNLFLGGEISKAISLTKWKQWSELLRPVGDFVVTALKGVLDYIKETDITFSFVEGKLELKPAGAEAARTN